MTKEAENLLGKWVAWYDTDDGDRTIDETRAYLASLERGDVARCPKCGYPSEECRVYQHCKAAEPCCHVPMICDRTEGCEYVRPRKPAEESVPDPAKWVSVEKVREVLDDPHYFASRANEVRRAEELGELIEALLPEPRSADDALAELQTFLAGLSPDETISPSTRKWMMERVKEARGIR